MTLEDKLLKYTDRNTVLKLDYLADKWNCEIRNLAELICDHSNRFGEIVFADEAVYLDYQDNEQWYYEVGNGRTTNGKRWFDRHHHIESHEIVSFIEEHEGLRDWHMSAFQHCNKWRKDFSDPHSQVRTPYIYLELDRGGDLDKAIEDAHQIITSFPFPRGVVAWWSGNTSIHIGIPSEYFGNPTCTNRKVCGRGKLFYNLARLCVGSARYDNESFDPHLSTVDQCKQEWQRLFGEAPVDDPQELRQTLEHFDPNIYYLNSMIRLPYSRHENGEQKIEVDIPDHDPDSGPPIKPYLLDWTYQAWEVITPPGRSRSVTDVTEFDSFVAEFYMDHVEGFDPDQMNYQGWVTNCYSPFYEDHNPDVSICIDTDHKTFGKYHDFGNPDDNCDFVGFVSRITGFSRRKSLTFIRKNS